MRHRLASRSRMRTRQSKVWRPRSLLPGQRFFTAAKAGWDQGTVDVEASGSAFVFSSFNDSHRRMRRGRK
jgi:hypothetical protein